MELLKGIDVANAINEKLIKESADMGGRVPKLAIIRVGERPDDMSYERGATKKMEKVGFACESFVFRKNLTQLMITLRLTVFYCFVRFQNT